MLRNFLGVLILLSGCAEPAAAPTSSERPTIRGKVSAGDDPLPNMRVRASAHLLAGAGQPRELPAGEAVSRPDGSFELVLTEEFSQAARSRNCWSWSLTLTADHPDVFAPGVEPSSLDSWDKLSGVQISFPDLQEDAAAEIRAEFERFRKNPDRTAARDGLEPAMWGPLQEVFETVCDAVRWRRSAREVVKSFEKDNDPHVRALAGEALGLFGVCQDDADRPPAPVDGPSALKVLEWTCRDVERSRHGGHYAAGANLDDGCTRCYSRWEFAERALSLLSPNEAKSFFAERRATDGKVGVFLALLAGEIRRVGSRESAEPPLLPDFDLSARIEAPLLFSVVSTPYIVGSQPLDVPVRIAPDGFLLSEVSWSPDGARAAGRGGYERGKTSEIWIVDADRGKVSRATWNNCIDWRPTWLPDGRRLLFVRNSVEGQDLWLLDAVTFEAKRLCEGDQFLDGVALHPDGKRVALAYREQKAILFDLDSGRKTPLVGDGGEASLPAWSPSGGQVLFSRERELHVVDPGGATPRRLSAHGITCGRAAWSPDGRWIAFSYLRDRSAGLGVVKPDGSGFRELRRFDTGPGDDDPAWSPDSRRVAFSPGAFEPLWICPIDGSPFRVQAPYGRNPVWRPTK